MLVESPVEFNTEYNKIAWKKVFINALDKAYKILSADVYPLYLNSIIIFLIINNLYI